MSASIRLLTKFQPASPHWRSPFVIPLRFGRRHAAPLAFIHGINSYLTRQALVVGLRHFARAMGHYVIAEGIETQEELTTLRSLDVRFGQGYLLGRPAVTAPRSTTDRVRAERLVPASA